MVPSWRKAGTKRDATRTPASSGTGDPPARKLGAGGSRRQSYVRSADSIST